MMIQVHKQAQDNNYWKKKDEVKAKAIYAATYNSKSKFIYLFKNLDS